MRGLGAISAALVDEVPGVRLFAVEVDATAVGWLRGNLIGTGAVVVEADMADSLTELDGQVDVVVANPPYIDRADRDALPAEVRHDPDRALFADEQGLAAIRVVRVALRLLQPGGSVVIEHGDDQAPSVLEALRTAGFVQATSHRDLTDAPGTSLRSGHPRPCQDWLVSQLPNPDDQATADAPPEPPGSGSTCPPNSTRPYLRPNRHWQPDG